MSERITLVAANAGGERLVIELQPDVKLEQVLELLNAGKGVSGNEIMVWYPAPMEGGQLLAKIVDRTAASKRVWAVLHEHKGECCPVLTDAERDRDFADRMVHRAHNLATTGNAKLARSLHTAAVALLDTCGDCQGDLGVWVLACESEIATQEGDLVNAERAVRDALVLAVKLNGETSPCAAICHGNIGEMLSKTDRKAEALASLETCLSLLATVEPSGLFVAEYLDGAREAFSKLKAELSAPSTT